MNTNPGTRHSAHTGIASLRITTMDGRLVNEYLLSGFENEKVIRINDLPDAVYITELIADGKRISNTKLTIVH